MNEPSIIYAGIKIEWTESLSDYLPSNGWTLKYTVLNANNRYDIVSTNDNDLHKISLLSADTAAWLGSDYALLQPYVEHTDGTIEILPRRTVKIEPNIINATTYDPRSHAQKTLEAIKAAIEGRASKEVLSLSITTRSGSTKSLQYLTMKEMIEALALYESKVESELIQEKIDAGIDPGNKILISFI